MIFIVDDLVRLYMADRSKVSGENATFRYFATTWKHDWSFDGAAFTFVAGHINYYASDGSRRESVPMLVKYVDLSKSTKNAECGFELFAREVTFFQTVLPAFDRVHRIRRLMPTYCASCPTMSAFSNVGPILFECPKGLGNFACANLLHPARLSRMAQTIAEFHACSFLVRRQNPAFLTDSELLRPLRAHFEHVLPKLNQLVDHFWENPSYTAQVQRLQVMLFNFGDNLNRPFSPDAQNHCWVLCHQSYSTVNLVFEQNSLNPTSILNWHSMGVASLGVDLVIMLFVESDASCKTALQPFIEEYRQVLLLLCPEQCPSEQDIVNEIKKCVPFALYVMADRILRAEAETEAVTSMFPGEVWNDELLFELGSFLMTNEYF